MNDPEAAAIDPCFFARPAEVVAPELLGCLLLKRQADGALLWGVIVETEAYCQSEPACHGYRRRSASNATFFGEPGRFYVYLTYGMYHCVNVVTGRCDWANGVLLRAAALPGEPERVAAGPGLLARRFGLDRGHDGTVASPASGLWLAHRPRELAVQQQQPPEGDEAGVVQTQRIGLSQGQELPWRWYLRGSRSVSRRARGDRTPRHDGLLARLASTVGTFDGSRTP
ncbi:MULTISPECIES: DNA-3-methyladenine glycosylase [unclassified Cyanobium]|uniref:DNA-3-methyladenine glycosylase n=1 Tax=unclassified Cyanobium TaxID=2627006 RepID=UPI0020CBEBD4|nr:MULTISPECIES: DNA-3-methyladenine glycosylase [unclassified Cyanobium]MCP9860155.1 DNA-3-methyladenine glycosylase [Cyanobium sp. Cruz-8H5]MCP9867405.1 DNA-3-methyladenine glycosylase [Cyanobium sp. Cruz-8D1]